MSLLQQNIDIFLKGMEKTKSHSIQELLDSREELSQHCKRVSDMAKSFGIHLGVSHRTLNSLTFGGFLHDIGKLRVKEETLFKAGDLDDEEFQAVAKHPELGMEEVSPFEHLLSKDVKDIILQHHERIDGKGYPNQLTGESINPLAQIISLCDVYDALTHKRVYKDALSSFETIEIIKKGFGKQFDETLGKKFLTFIEKKWLVQLNDNKDVM